MNNSTVHINHFQILQKNKKSLDGFIFNELKLSTVKPFI